MFAAGVPLFLLYNLVRHRKAVVYSQNHLRGHTNTEEVNALHLRPAFKAIKPFEAMFKSFDNQSYYFECVHLVFKGPSSALAAVLPCRWLPPAPRPLLATPPPRAHAHCTAALPACRNVS